MDEPEYNEGENTESGLMYVVCAKCKAWIDVKPGRMNLISHGLCKTCYAEAERELDEAATDAVTRDP
jgi:hypothetical protein